MSNQALTQTIRIMDYCLSYRPRLKKNILTTRKKMKVLSAMTAVSKKYIFDNDCECNCNNMLEHGTEVMTLLQSEQVYVECLEKLKNCLENPVLKEVVESLDDIIKVINEMLSAHSNFYKVLLCGESDLSNALKQLSLIFNIYITYSILINLQLNNFQSISELFSLPIIDLLHEPVLHISRYKTTFNSLYSIQPNEAYSEILKAVEYANDRIQNITLMKKNALRTLQIQRLLIKRQPKIFCPERTIIKEGVLYKVTCHGRSLKKRVFFLFNDILLCCKILSNKIDWQEKDSLLFSSLFPLNSCSVNFVMGSITSKGALFKISSNTLSYLLLSKTPGESQVWVKELQKAIRALQQVPLDSKSKLIRQKNICTKQRISPFLKRVPKPLESPTGVEQNIKIESMSMSEFCTKSSSLGEIMKILTCLKL